MISGLREILTDKYAKGLGADGVMLDTFDTPIPNGWTDKRSANPCEFEWTAIRAEDAGTPPLEEANRICLTVAVP